VKTEDKEQPVVKPIESPDGIDLHPQPDQPIRVSRRAGMIIVGIVVLLALAFAYGGYRRTVRAEAAARDSGSPKSLAPATAASKEFTRDIPAGSAPMTKTSPGAPEPANAIPALVAPGQKPPCGADPRSRFDPITGQPCDSHAQPTERIIVRQSPPVRDPVLPAPAPHEPSPEEKRLLAAYQKEQEAALAPMGIRSATATGTNAWNSQAPPRSPAPENETLIARPVQSDARTGSQPAGTSEYELQNMQEHKESFADAPRTRKNGEYLPNTRTQPVSEFEIKAGWEIPAVLEQGLNSDLPGELKALVTSNVFDTATGVYLLIPQGSRLIGKYDSRISYGQDGVQVAWNRVIFPDASSLDLDGMVGLDSHGNSGLRDQVDRHYKRLFGFAALTSLFTAAFDISQRRNQSVLSYPNPAETAGSAIGREVSETGATITRHNLNVQPTIKVPVGYKFTVRVNKDIVFEAPYEPARAVAPLVVNSQRRAPQ
jgi:type IV secretory pathway VirB10-like protein